MQVEAIAQSAHRRFSAENRGARAAQGVGRHDVTKMTQTSSYAADFRPSSMPASRAAALAIFFAAHAACADATAGERLPADPLRVAVYDLAPYGSVGPDGLFSGASVDLWRRVAEEMHWRYQFTLVSRMDAILAGLEQDQVRRGDRGDHHHARAARAGGLFLSSPSLRRRGRVRAQDRPAFRAGELRRGGFRTRLVARDHARPAAVDRRPDVGARTSARPSGACGRFRGANIARRPLLGRGHDDHGRLWRQDAEDSDRPQSWRCLDAREPRVDFAVLRAAWFRE